jgi:hypothetical protein
MKGTKGLPGWLGLGLWKVPKKTEKSEKSEVCGVRFGPDWVSGLFWI